MQDSVVLVYPFGIGFSFAALGRLRGRRLCLWEGASCNPALVFSATHSARLPKFEHLDLSSPGAIGDLARCQPCLFADPAELEQLLVIMCACEFDGQAHDLFVRALELFCEMVDCSHHFTSLKYLNPRCTFGDGCGSSRRSKSSAFHTTCTPLQTRPVT